MVVATHGRSIWILDDLTPFHQLYDLLKERKRPGATHLFQPRSSERMRVIGGYPGVAAQATISRGPAWPGMVSYGRTGTNIIRVLPLRRPDGAYDNLLLDSGKNPPYGVVVQYYLAKPAKSAALSFLDEKGRELRSYPGAPAKAGINRFLWNRRLPGAPDVKAKDLEPWNRPDGPMVVPGRYAVRLTVDGESRTQRFEILPDPRIKAKPAALREQFAFLNDILRTLSMVNSTISEIDARVLKKNQDRRKLDAIRGALIDVNYSQAQLWASGLHEKLNALFDTVDSGDFAPSRQAREVYAALGAEADGLAARWKKLNP